jgi:hypothetical protein
MRKLVRENTQPVFTPQKLAKDKNPNAVVTGTPKRNFGFAKKVVFVSDDLFLEDLKP